MTTDEYRPGRYGPSREVVVRAAHRGVPDPGHAVEADGRRPARDDRWVMRIVTVKFDLGGLDTWHYGCSADFPGAAAHRNGSIWSRDGVETDGSRTAGMAHLLIVAEEKSPEVASLLTQLSV